MKKDYYHIIGINDEEKSINGEEFFKILKKKYRALCLKFHPDKNPDDIDAEEKFKEINEANDILSDPQKRAQYDQYGHDFENKGAFDPFEQLRRQYARQQSKGKNVHVTVSLTIEDCYYGCEKRVDYPIQQTCSGCTGNGSKNGNSLHTCVTCGGTGVQTIVRQIGGFHHIQTQTTCSSCHGNGRIVEASCDQCDGYGSVIYDENIVLTFPRGVFHGQNMRVSGRGHYSNVQGGDRGDAIFVIEEVIHEKFERINADIFYKHKISFEDLALGVNIDVPTISGKLAKISVEPGSNNGKLYRLKKRGMPVKNLSGNSTPENSPDSAFGNYIVELQIDIPTEFSEEEIELLKKLKEIKSKKFA